MMTGVQGVDNPNTRKTKKIYKHCLRKDLDDYENDFNWLLRKSEKVTMEIKGLRYLATEIFKTVNNVNPNYMKNIFTPKLHPKVRPNDILVKHRKTIHYTRCKKPKNIRF